MGFSCRFSARVLFQLCEPFERNNYAKTGWIIAAEDLEILWQRQGNLLPVAAYFFQSGHSLILRKSQSTNIQATEYFFAAGLVQTLRTE